MTAGAANNKRAGRRPGDSDVTKQAILEAARQQFGAVGFDRATIRGIAKIADVDPALIIHYFGNKQKLFVDAHELPVDPSDVFAPIVSLPVEERGEALTRLYLEVFTQTGSPILSLMRAAATNDGAAKMLREFITRALIDHGEDLVVGADRKLRVALIGSHFVGLLFARQLVGIEQLVQADVEDLTAMMAPAIQQYINAY